MTGTRFRIGRPQNEPVLRYLPGSPERKDLNDALDRLASEVIDIPAIVNGREVRGDETRTITTPFDHGMVIGKYHPASEEVVREAIESSLRARERWSRVPWYDRAPIFMKAAELLSGPWRATMNAAAILGLGKTVHQAEIDSAAELIDFLRFNTYYMQTIYETQPESVAGEWNRIEYRPLEGFVFAVTPFNFVSIMGNLPTAPAIMGNTVVWKPASSAVYPSYLVMKLLIEAGLPDGVINFVPASAEMIGRIVFRHPQLAGVHFTGSTAVFREMWKTVGENISSYRSFPRLVGETGGKGFVFAHHSADVDELVVALIRGAFEYAGQKCSAASRAYVPASLWPRVREALVNDLSRLRVSTPTDFSTFMSAVIDREAFDRIVGYIELAKHSADSEIVFGGEYDDSEGYFIQPTVVLTKNPRSRLMEEEIFGPVLTVYVYPDNEFTETLRLCNDTSPYALTGSIFARDRQAITIAIDVLQDAAGNLYINDKPTGAVVGRQPFGGARASGTNDKAGSPLNLLRWVSPRTLKENFVPPRDFLYPHMVSD
ncbi:MAG: L-glutamate gamma-semialdehyde dehydrogenase [Candidatus Thorarchaeota archaeon]